MRVKHLKQEFVEQIPDQLADGVIYVSIPYATVAHRCCCGCGYEVITPLTPTDWQLTFDGESISLTPSIGNWSFECQSHYWIERGHVRWARRLARGQIDAGRARARARSAARIDPTVDANPGDDLPSDVTHGDRHGVWSLVRRLFSR